MIKDIKAREIIDSRGNPTVEVSLFTNQGKTTSSVPSGASTGSFEAKEIRDGGERFGGKGVLEAVSNVNNKISSALKGEDLDPLKIDKILIDLDGTKDKSNLGANAILGVSMSVFRATAKKNNISFYDYISANFDFEQKIPVPCFNIINGGVHSGGGVSFQEFMVVPEKDSFSENLRFAVEFYKKLKQKILLKYGANSVNIGDEGGFVPDIKKTEDVFNLLKEVDSSASLIVDVASTEFYKEEKYLLDSDLKNKEEMIVFYKDLRERFPIIGFEDPLMEDDFTGWGELKKELPDILIIGDDLLTTNTKRIQKAEESNSCNAMILKINQIGTVSEALQSAKTAQELQWKIIVSHRSGETNDDFIADFAVGIGADYIKSGAPARGERVAKYNRLLEIEDEKKQQEK
ncbi:MAG: phosphopyruvate hydratase [Candidatus Pacebacteria bacterium]|nr:phosphopyruvate hydratase [Candidatus Paceibacterota bacterium]